MPIHVPGIRKGPYAKGVKRDVVAVLQLTAMVDMFTVLVVFLLQNYAVTDQILPLSERLALPQATSVKELKPSHVVILTEGSVSLDTEELGSIASETSDAKWVFEPLKTRMIELIKQSEEGGEAFLISQLKKLKQTPEDEEKAKKAPFRVTIQADESAQFMLIKRIMFTLTEAGIKEMNFAVIKKPDMDMSGS